jgi:hypothetical protein
LAYLRHRAERGAPRSTLRKLAQYLLVVTERLNLQREGTVTATQIERAADQWARRQVQHKIKGGFSRKSKLCFVCVASNWLQLLGRLEAPKTRPHRFAQLLDDFAKYMEQEKGLAPRTIITRCWVAKDFLRRALRPKRAFHEITIRQIDEVLAHKGTEGGYSRRGIQSYVSGLRPFFRYAEQRNLEGDSTSPVTAAGSSGRCNALSRAGQQLKRESLMWISPWYLMKPSFLNLFMNKLTRV